MTRIQTRLVLAFMLVILLTLASVGVSVYGLARVVMLAGAQRALLTQAREVAVLLADYPLGRSTELRRELMGRLMPKLTEARLILLSARGEALFETQRPPAGLLQSPVVRRALSEKVPSTGRVRGADGRAMLAACAPVLSGGNLTGAVLLYSPVSAVSAGQRQVTAALLRAALLATVVAAVASYLLARGIARPVQALEAAARSLARGEYVGPVAVESRDEIGQLVHTFNSMAARLFALVAETARERAKLEAILGSMGDGLLAFDEEGRFLLANPVARQLLDRTETELTGRRFGEVLPPQASTAVKEALLWAGGESGEVRRDVSWGERAFTLRATPIDASGRPMGVVLLLQDVTASRDLERLRRDFIASVSHELRTPVTSITGFVEALADGLAADPEARARHLRIIAEETRRLNRLIADLFDVARLDAGQLELNLTPQHIDGLVERSVGKIVPLADKAGVSLCVRPGAQGGKVLADGDRIAQVLLNLLDNGLRYSPSGGALTVLTEASKGEVTVSVADTGPGIAPGELTRVFERFYRVDKARTRSQGGTGLGLAIVKRLVEAHGGRVWVESAEGHGSVFRFTLPLLPAE
ncbi:MAG: ATP-binding protein [Bacillota bacterium]